MSTQSLTRKTKESEIHLTLTLYGSGEHHIQTGIGFFDHMLKTLCFYAKFDMQLKATGDLEVDTHHTVEDVGIVLGQLLYSLQSELPPISRFGTSILPMDDALVRSVIDLGGRSYLRWESPAWVERVGDFETETLTSFLDAFSRNGWFTLHIDVLSGKNAHHIIEALFKSLGLSLQMALKQTAISDSSIKGKPVWKGSVT